MNLGSARVSRVGFGVAPKRTFLPDIDGVSRGNRLPLSPLVRTWRHCESVMRCPVVSMEVNPP
jgi:hypothetical protein